MNKKNTFADALRISSTAANKAMGVIGGMNGSVGDPDIETYNALTPQAFTAISKKYGFGNTLAYIQEMEAKRLQKMVQNG